MRDLRPKVVIPAQAGTQPLPVRCEGDMVGRVGGFSAATRSRLGPRLRGDDGLWPTLGLALVLLVLCTGRAGAVEPPLQEVGIDQRLGEQVPLDLSVRDESGASVQLGQYFGQRPVILSLVYYRCPMLCTLVLNGLVRALNALSFAPGGDVEIVTVSINPEETAEQAAAKKRQYVESYRRPGAAAAWHFLTADEATIGRLAQSVGFRYRRDAESGEYAHASAIMVLTAGGRVARYLFGVEYAPRDLRLALVEAGEGKIGTAVDQLLLLCFRYDPATGRYSTAIINAVRAGGALTVLVLVGFVVLMRRRERRGRAAGAMTPGEVEA